MSAGSVKLCLVDRQLKLFKNALQSLHKLGPELMIEAHPGRLCLRVISISQSAYMSMSYSSNFFDSYDVFGCNVTQAVVLFKHVLSVFRTQRVDKIVFELKTDEARVSVTLHCENGMLKRYKFPTVDGEVLQATVDRTTFPVCLVAETAAMTRLLSTFHSTLSEVTITAHAEGTTQGGSVGKSVQLRSYLDRTKTALDQSLHTLLSLDATPTFVSYTHNSDEAVEATFNLKDFRAMLGLCDSLGCRIKLLFSGPGSPLVAEPLCAGGREGVDFEAELIVATLTVGLEPMASQPTGNGGTRERQIATPGERAMRSGIAGDAALDGSEHHQRFCLKDTPIPLQGANERHPAQLDHPAALDSGRSVEYGDEAVPSTPLEEQGPGATMPGVIAVARRPI